MERIVKEAKGVILGLAGAEHIQEQFSRISQQAIRLLLLVRGASLQATSAKAKASEAAQ